MGYDFAMTLCQKRAKRRPGEIPGQVYKNLVQEKRQTKIFLKGGTMLLKNLMERRLKNAGKRVT